MHDDSMHRFHDEDDPREYDCFGHPIRGDEDNITVSLILKIAAFGLVLLVAMPLISWLWSMLHWAFPS